MTDEEEKQTLLESALDVCMDFTSRLDSVFEGKSDSELVDTIAEIDRIPAVSGMIWYKIVRDHHNEHNRRRDRKAVGRPRRGDGAAHA
jgi:hypothetical protein